MERLSQRGPFGTLSSKFWPHSRRNYTLSFCFLNRIHLWALFEYAQCFCFWLPFLSKCFCKQVAGVPFVRAGSQIYVLWCATCCPCWWFACEADFDKFSSPRLVASVQFVQCQILHCQLNLLGLKKNFTVRYTKFRVIFTGRNKRFRLSRNRISAVQ